VRRSKWVALLCSTVMFLGVAGAAGARAKKRKRMGRAIHMHAVKVKGKVQLPQAFYVLPRSSLNFRVLKLKESFIPKLLDSVSKKPF